MKKIKSFRFICTSLFISAAAVFLLAVPGCASSSLAGMQAPEGKTIPAGTKHTADMEPSEQKQPSVPADANKLLNDGHVCYTQEQIETLFDFIPAYNVDDPTQLTEGRFVLGQPVREEEGWFFNVYRRKKGSGESFKPRYNGEGRKLTHLPQVKHEDLQVHGLYFDLSNHKYDYGDTIEYYFELKVIASNQKFTLFKEEPLTYHIREFPTDPEDLFRMEPVPGVSSGKDYDAWIVCNMEPERIQLDQITLILYYRTAGTSVWHTREAPRVIQGFKAAVPTSGQAPGTRMEFYGEFFRQGQSLGTYGSPLQPISFQVIP